MTLGPKNNSGKRIHIIGICGVGTSAIAIALHQNGWRVSGSDKGFYPPVSTALTESGVPYYAGWHPEKMTSAEYGGVPKIIMIGGSGKASSNPEMLYAKEHGIPQLSYPEILEQYFLREHSIVCVGTWGKTTSTTLLTFILQKAGLDPSYMFGGLSLSQEQAAKVSDGNWSVLEGDEYTGSQTDNVAKFFHYHPTHLLMTSVSWDHADVYPTERSYFEAFEKLLADMPKDALVVACTDDSGVQSVLKNTTGGAGGAGNARIKLVSYGKNAGAAYRYENVVHTRNGLAFDIVVSDDKIVAGGKTKSGKTFHTISPMLGAYNAENITACFAMACEIGIASEKIIAAVAAFKGIKRRLEKRYEGDVTILDCHAPTAEKARSVLQSIREVFPKPHRIIAVFEPNIGGRQRETAHLYDGAFADADEVIIPRLTVLKKDLSQKDAPNQKSEPLEGAELTRIISKTAPTAAFMEDDAKLVAHIVQSAKKGDVIAFLGSHGFRGMIEETVEIAR